MNRNVGIVLAMIVLLAPVSAPAFAWGSATHAYVAEHLGARLEPLSAAQVYGAVAPDMFQLDMSLAFDPLVEYYTHGAPGQEGFMAVWSGARGWIDKASALGWVSHNNVWGADFKAHDPLTGYVIQKATLLDDALANAGVWAQVQNQLGFPLPPDDRLLFCHIVVETDGDIILRQIDPGLGERLTSAALLRPPSFPRLLAGAMQGVDPAVVRTMEARFRKYMLLYGAMLAQDDETTFRLMGADVARQALAYLVFVHPELQVEQIRGLVTDLSLAAMQQAAPLLGDYPAAVEDTIGFVAGELATHHVGCGRP